MIAPSIKILVLFAWLIFHTSAVAEVWNDIGRLNPETVQAVIAVESEADVVDVLRRSGPGSHVVVSGTRHSQGGHIMYPNAIVLDMTKFNDVISISKTHKTITVQSGATWAQIQQRVNRHGLSVKVMQSSNIFFFCVSLSANIHGRDPAFGPLIESVNRLKIALPSGDIVTASRQKMPDLFYAAIGGYGLIGVILEAEIELTDNVQLKKSTTQIDYKEYPATITSTLGKAALHYGRCSIVRGRTFLRECYATNFLFADSTPIESALVTEKNVWINSLLLSFSRISSLGKSLRWELQKKFLDVPGEEMLIDRNNAMRPPIEFLKYEGEEDTDILQEYFVPVSSFVAFMDDLRNELIKADVNLLSNTLRYLRNNNESILSYSREDMIAIVLYINIQLGDASIDRAKKWTRNLVASALTHNGSYYLTYQRFPTLEQFQSAYPNWQQFSKVKCKYDPNLVLMNKFYNTYFNVTRQKACRQKAAKATSLIRGVM